MKYERTYNFSAGPAMMPEAVLEEIRDEMMNYRGSGMCVMEMSHRSKVFMQIAAEAEQDLRDLMGIPENYKVIFVQGGGTLQFAMVAMNLLKDGTACYVETGTWSKKAIAEAKKYGNVKVVASSKDKNFTCVPIVGKDDFSADADYVHICFNTVERFGSGTIFLQSMTFYILGKIVQIGINPVCMTSVWRTVIMKAAVRDPWRADSVSAVPAFRIGTISVFVSDSVHPEPHGRFSGKFDFFRNFGSIFRNIGVFRSIETDSLIPFQKFDHTIIGPPVKHPCRPTTGTTITHCLRVFAS